MSPEGTNDYDVPDYVFNNAHVFQLSLRDKYLGHWITICPIFENIGFVHHIAARWVF